MMTQLAAEVARALVRRFVHSLVEFWQDASWVIRRAYRNSK